MAELFETTELDRYAREILKIAQNDMPRETKKFIRTEGRKLRTATRKKARKRVKKKTGNYLKGIKSGKAYIYRGNGGLSIRVYAGKPAYHGHLIEYGHIIKNKKGGPELGFVRGFNVFDEAGKEFQSEFFSDTEKFIDEIARDLW